MRRAGLMVLLLLSLVGCSRDADVPARSEVWQVLEPANGPLPRQRSASADVEAGPSFRESSAAQRNEAACPPEPATEPGAGSTTPGTDRVYLIRQAPEKILI